MVLRAFILMHLTKRRPACFYFGCVLLKGGGGLCFGAGFTAGLGMGSSFLFFGMKPSCTMSCMEHRLRSKNVWQNDAMNRMNNHSHE